MVTAVDIMNRNVVQLERGTSITEAAKIMVEKHMGSIIVAAAGYPIGIVTETDITKVIATGKDPHATFIEEVMSSPLFSTTPEVELIQIINTMSTNHIKKMPVMDHQQVVGMITQTDVIKHALQVCSNLQEPRTGNMAAFTHYSSQLLRSVKTLETTREWHMKCTACGHQFLNEEHDGKLVTQACPKCSGQIEYDLSPPL